MIQHVRVFRLKAEFRCSVLNVVPRVIAKLDGGILKMRTVFKDGYANIADVVSVLGIYGITLIRMLNRVAIAN